MKKQTYFIIITSILLFVLLGVIIYDFLDEKRITLHNGEYDFSEYEIDDSYVLNGDWEVYPGLLIQTDEWDTNLLTPEIITLPVRFPSSMDYGYVSYRAVLKNVTQSELIELSLDGYYDGYAIYFNQVLVGTNGNLQKNRNPVTLGAVESNYVNNQDDLEIIIEISNYKLNYTGMARSPYFASTTSFSSHLMTSLIGKFILVGALFFSLLYQLIIIGLRSREKSSIYFSIFILMAILSVVFSLSPYSLVSIGMVHISAQILFYFQHMSVFIGTLFLYLTIMTLYHPSKITKVDYALISGVGLLIIIPFTLYFKTLMSSIFYFGLFNIFILIMMLLCSLIRRKDNTYHNFIATMIAFILGGAIYDVLIHQNILTYVGEILPTVILICVMLYSSITTFIHEQEISNVQEIVELNKKIRDTEFTFLNSQIQSHFIYNTLNSIQSLCITNPLKAAELIEEFSMYLRTRLEFNKMPILVNFEDELEHIRTYLNIEKERYGNRIRFQYDLKKGDFMVPPLTVQPLVENAVKHGISMKKSGGTIIISTYENNKGIYIKIEDDGLGFDPKSLSEKQRVGTENIRYRLNLHLGANLTISSRPNEGTVSIIHIPNNK